MANSTVYPYGTGGSLPSSIGLINDLKTGGVNRALTAQQGVVLSDMITTQVLSVAPDTDKIGSAFNSSGAVVSLSGYGIATIPITKGKWIKIFGGPLKTGTSYAAICFSEDGTTWTPLFFGSSNSARWYQFRAESDGYVGVCFSASEKVTIAYESDEQPEKNAKESTIIAKTKVLFTIESSTSVKNFTWAYSSENYKGVEIAVEEDSDRTNFFALTNASYTPSRMVGMKGGKVVRHTNTASDYIVTDSVLGKLLKVVPSFKVGVDTVFWIFSKSDGYEQTDYDSFGITNTYNEAQEIRDIAKKVLAKARTF